MIIIYVLSVFSVNSPIYTSLRALMQNRESLSRMRYFMQLDL